jgi:molybdopterin-guanine dinucleotide biosynthesis protein A
VGTVSALILAGGKATRMGGVAKHELVVDGRSIFDRQVAVLAPRVAEILVSSPARVGSYRTLRDPVEGAGPLAGIAAGLRATTTPWLLVVAGDMPYLTGELLDRLIAATGDELDAVGVRAGGLPEPLLCVLHARVLAAVERRLAAGRYKASGLLTDEGLRLRWLDDADPAALRNLNSPEDLRS